MAKHRRQPPGVLPELARREPPGFTVAERLDRILAASESADYAAIPGYMWDGIVEYVARLRPTGDFLLAVFANDFAGAVTRADTGNDPAALRAYALLLYNEVPAQAWGSRQKVIDWLASKPRICECGHTYERHHRLSKPGAVEDGPCAECADCLKFTERAEPVTGSESDDQGEGGQADGGNPAAT
jgi:hypothetical protein